MSSMYNLKLTCAEFWVKETELKQIRMPFTLEMFMDQFNCDKPVLPEQNYHKANLEMDSIDEDENELFLSPER